MMCYPASGRVVSQIKGLSGFKGSFLAVVQPPSACSFTDKAAAQARCNHHRSMLSRLGLGVPSSLTDTYYSHTAVTRHLHCQSLYKSASLPLTSNGTAALARLGTTCHDSYPRQLIFALMHPEGSSHEGIFDVHLCVPIRRSPTQAGRSSGC